jgi:hypothetical protein
MHDSVTVLQQYWIDRSDDISRCLLEYWPQGRSE